MSIRYLLPLMFVLTTPALAHKAVNNAAKTLKASLAKQLPEHAELWSSYLMLDRLEKATSIDVNMRDVMSCRLDQTNNRPEYQAPVTDLAGFGALRRAIEEIKFTPEEIKLAGRGPGHSPVTCRPAKYVASPPAQPDTLTLDQKRKIGPSANFGKAPFSIFQIRYWPFTPEKEGACQSPMLIPATSANPKIEDKAVAKCRDFGFRSLEALMKNPPRECATMHQLGGPFIFNMTIASYQPGGKDKSCRMTNSLRRPWVYDRTAERPPWAPDYDRGYIMWPVEHFAPQTYQTKDLDQGIRGIRNDGCRIPTRFDLVRFCAETLAEINAE